MFLHSRVKADRQFPNRLLAARTSSAPVAVRVMMSLRTTTSADASSKGESQVPLLLSLMMTSQNTSAMSRCVCASRDCRNLLEIRTRASKAASTWSCATASVVCSRWMTACKPRKYDSSFYCTYCTSIIIGAIF